MVKYLIRIMPWLIWAISALVVGAMKPLFFPEGGIIYASAAIVLMCLSAILVRISNGFFKKKFFREK
ncbi:hypothetical protein FHY16_003038 [Xanthomonas campestris]|uniref:hypothetical protein n=1 Tax=Xanthomonas euroxanthea TaxID=2259622 RepID=UPI001617E2C6|nr:hypothetical protein [Xanthomonas euroxanthea]MBB3780255.1 hypothetical protein [Xanthomonas euroxanthea]